MNKEELKELRDEITIIRADVYTILYLLYNFMKKPESVDFDTFYKGRFKENVEKHV